MLTFLFHSALAHADCRCTLTCVLWRCIHQLIIRIVDQQRWPRTFLKRSIDFFCWQVSLNSTTFVGQSNLSSSFRNSSTLPIPTPKLWTRQYQKVHLLFCWIESLKVVDYVSIWSTRCKTLAWLFHKAIVRKTIRRHILNSLTDHFRWVLSISHRFKSK